MSKNKVLVLGATGMLGRTVYKYLKSIHGENVSGSSRRKKDNDLIYLDAGKTSLDLIFKKNRFDYIINCIGTLRGAGEKDLRLTNSIFPKKLLKSSENYGFKIINISTDAVFKDNAGIVNEKSPPNPQDWYGKSKLKGELYKNTLNIRTSILGLDPDEHKGILEFAILKKNKKIHGFLNQSWSGATTLQLAKFIDWIIFKNKLNLILQETNIIHFAPISKTSKYHILKIFSKLIGSNNVARYKGKKISRILSTKYFDEIELKRYTYRLDSAIKEVIRFDKDYAEKLKKK